MKKKVLFVADSMWTGGIAKAMLSVFGLLDPEQYDVTLILVEMSGDMLDRVPSWIKMVELPLRPFDRYALNHKRIQVIKRSLLTWHWFYAAMILWQRLLWYLRGRKYNFYIQQTAEIVKRSDILKIQTEYDFAFAYAGADWATCVVRYLIHAPVTATWIHDESLVSKFSERDVREVFTPFTYRFAVSEQLTKMINGLYGQWGAPFETMPHIIDYDCYRKLAADSPDPAFGNETKLKLLTVARLSYQKGIDYAIKIASWLKKDGYSFCWYVVGGGEKDNCYENELRQMIEELNVGDVFKLLGKRDNPYPYFRDCDIYLQPSRFEAFCLTISEAKAFNKPIVATDFAGARDQIVNGETGLITALNNPKAFYLAVKTLLDDEQLRQRLSANLHDGDPKPPRSASEKWAELLSGPRDL